MKEHSQTGFVAGTSVHTENGLVAIQDIKIGDMVLSSPKSDNGEVKEYKRVANTFTTESQEIYEILFRKRIYPADEETNDDIPYDVYEFIYLSATHPVFVKNSHFIKDWDKPEDEEKILARSGTWESAKELRLYDGIVLSSPQHETSDDYEVVYISPVQDTELGFGFAGSSYDEKPFDSLVVFREDQYKVIVGDISQKYSYNIKIDTFISPANMYKNKKKQLTLVNAFYDKYIEQQFNDNAPVYINGANSIKVDVYNLEVEDDATYFVGEQGLWVGV